MDSTSLSQKDLPVISREQAKELGLNQFFTGKPCRNGHVCPRYVSNSVCFDCLRVAAKIKKEAVGKPDCSIDGCSNPSHLKSLCRSHYQILLRRGNPLDRVYAPKGDARKWIEEHRNYSENECLIWPFGKDANGYGQIFLDGKNTRAHIVMCSLANGPSPQPGLFACHSCGNGHLGCIHPGHLKWGTRLENAQDRYEHGRTPFGELSMVAKLSASDIPVIRGLASTMTYENIGRMYGVTGATISCIVKRKTWRHIP